MLVYIIFKDHVFEVVIEKHEIQQVVDSKLPFRKKYFLFFELVINAADVIIIDGEDRIGINSKMELGVNIGKEKDSFDCAVLGSGKIRYEQNDGALYLNDLRVDKLNLQGVPEKYKNKMSEIATLLLKDYYLKKPIYRLDRGSIKIQMARLILKNLKIINGKLHLYMGY